jgi:hypothetical protein
MKKLLLRLGLSIVGTIVTLLWWTYHDKGSNAQSMSHIPAKLAEGGNQLLVEVEGSTPSTMRIDFEDLSKPVGQQILMNAWEKVPAGPHTWTVDIPSGVGGYIEFEADQPKPGDTLTQRVKINGKEVDSQTERLDSPLEPNTAFFVQFQRNDFSHTDAAPEE